MTHPCGSRACRALYPQLLLLLHSNMGLMLPPPHPQLGSRPVTQAMQQAVVSRHGRLVPQPPLRWELCRLRRAWLQQQLGVVHPSGFLAPVVVVGAGASAVVVSRQRPMQRHSGSRPGSSPSVAGPRQERVAAQMQRAALRCLGSSSGSQPSGDGVAA